MRLWSLHWPPVSAPLSHMEKYIPVAVPTPHPQAVRLSALGSHADADAAMARLGLVARLSDEVWACCRSADGVHSPSGEEGNRRTVAASAAVEASRGDHHLLMGGATVPAPEPACEKMMMASSAVINGSSSSDEAVAAQLATPLLFESACPALLLSRLQRAFSPSSPFWSEHGYFEEESPYFSYLYDLVRGGRGFPMNGCLWARLVHTAGSQFPHCPAILDGPTHLRSPRGRLLLRCPIDSPPRYRPLLPVHQGRPLSPQVLSPPPIYPGTMHPSNL